MKHLKPLRFQEQLFNFSQSHLQLNVDDHPNFHRVHSVYCVVIVGTYRFSWTVLFAFCLAPIVLSEINWKSQRGFAAGGQSSLQRKYFIPDSHQGAFKDVCWTMLPSCCPLKVTGLAF